MTVRLGFRQVPLRIKDVLDEGNILLWTEGTMAPGAFEVSQ
jgi:hypothetical protein